MSNLILESCTDCAGNHEAE